ncbi:hypothetical protein VOLCADRAFT_98698 [Volvox carteri f. nagariensis]|uniref:BOP1 N-terminal domain-containing protein n=1 Tax=Volvox carteri f. nagariensis TaxID=3068 RepID=D8UG18_VOLCA|nr:uncharacterized protein VOLCADRAFT_98698 [Volvox carteri f. nagariensis]EFJ41352.1 hypothetical protein VOLCADRAFT_98698 [Volvox carteri f. nagariensis]|eukprot:XP_002957582.1 hypothetical protein VOLCADRAFT_98698 [Volvox carteri f. nagariensis]
MAKRNAKREPVKEVESESEDELEELNLDDEASSDDADSDVDADGEDESDEEEDAGTASDAGEDDEIDDAILELMAAQAERAQRRAAARTTASEGDEPEERRAARPRFQLQAFTPLQASTRTVGKSRMAATAAAVAADEEGAAVAADEEGAAVAAGRGAGGEGGPGAEEGDADERGEGRVPDPGSDSSEDERPNRNTVGAVPLEWYKDEEHIGYDIDGRRIARSVRKDKLQQLLDRNDSKKVNPYEPYNDYFSREREMMPIVDRPEPKSRFVPSKWEEKKIVKLVRAIRKGWIRIGPQKLRDPEDLEDSQPPAYLLWADDGTVEGGEGGPGGRSGSGLTYIPAPKPQLPGHADSYNPPAEYLPTEEEMSAWRLADPEDRPRHLPTAFPSLRAVPAYGDFIKERFERCLDLYLCPRVRRKSGGQDGTMRLWEVRTGRCWRTWQLGAGPVAAVSWCPNPALRLVSGVVGSSVVLVGSGTGAEEAEEAAAQVLQVASTSGRHGADDQGATDPGVGPEPSPGELAVWRSRGSAVGGGLEIRLRFPVKSLSWHSRGDYFASVAPAGNTQAVVVHQLSKRASQNPFRKNRGRVVRVAFHPSKPFFFVATQNHVRVYNLAKQALAKKLLGGAPPYPCESCRRPVSLSNHHLVYSLVQALCGNVFYGMVYGDLLTNPLIVPVKILRGDHSVVRSEGVLDCAFHPNQPWIFTAGADAKILLYCN